MSPAAASQIVELLRLGENVLRFSVLLAAVFFFATTISNAAGIQFFEIPADGVGRRLTGAVWHPCATRAAQEIKIENRIIFGAKDCEIAGGRLPLVVISHGRRAWFGAHHDTASTLADAGYLVAAINHPGDNSFDESRVDSLAVFVERPADITRLLNFLLGGWTNKSKIDHDRIGLFGFSMGGYTSLVVIGANPDFRSDLAGCVGNRLRACEQLQNNEGPTGPPAYDSRVKAAVIVDPGPSIFFPAERLKSVNVPIQLWSSDPKLSKQFDSGCCGFGIRNRLPSKADFHLATGAIHVSFLAPCSPEEHQKSEFSRICTDAPDFDRVAFHKNFHAEVLGFFRRNILESGKLQ